LNKRQRPKPAKRARTAPDPHRGRLRQADERAKRLTALRRLTRLMTSVTDSAAAFRGIGGAATLLLKAKMAYVWVDEGRETLREGGSYWAGPELAGRIVRTDPVPRDTGSIAGAVLLSRRPEYIADVQRDSRWRNRVIAETRHLHACIALPLIHHDRAVGALIVVAFAHRDDFTAEEKNLAGLLADQAATGTIAC
jgi:GAF domain-containing protein